MRLLTTNNKALNKKKQWICINGPNVIRIINNFIMQALRRIPKVLEGVEDLRNNGHLQIAFTEYKQNVKLFIESIKAEVSQLIDRYQKTIAQLKAQNRALKQGQPSKQFVRTARATSPIKDQSSLALSSNKGNNLDMMQTAKSNVFNPYRSPNFDEDVRLSTMLSKFKRTKDEDNQFPVQLINSPEIGNASRFQAMNKRKKQREGQLIHFLETGNKNLKGTTQRFLQSIGRGKKQEVDSQLELNRDKDNSQSSNSIRKDSNLNKSLGNVCNSLDTSYVSKKARSEKKKRMGQVEEERRRKKEQEEEIGRMMKVRGVRSLLQRLRDNIQISTLKNPQIIKTSKLINCGVVDASPSPLRKSSKVMINPVPVDIARKSLATGSRNSRAEAQAPNSPTRQPQSILKQSSNILTRSLSGISAIEFNP